MIGHACEWKLGHIIEIGRTAHPGIFYGIERHDLKWRLAKGVRNNDSIEFISLELFDKLHTGIDDRLQCQGRMISTNTLNQIR